MDPFWHESRGERRRQDAQNELAIIVKILNDDSAQALMALVELRLDESKRRKKTLDAPDRVLGDCAKENALAEILDWQYTLRGRAQALQRELSQPHQPGDADGRLESR